MLPLLMPELYTGEPWGVVRGTWRTRAMQQCGCALHRVRSAPAVPSPITLYTGSAYTRNT